MASIAPLLGPEKNSRLTKAVFEGELRLYFSFFSALTASTFWDWWIQGTCIVVDIIFQCVLDVEG